MSILEKKNNPLLINVRQVVLQYLCIILKSKFGMNIICKYLNYKLSSEIIHIYLGLGIFIEKFNI